MSRGALSARAAGKVSFAVLISRILGLVRDQVFARFFGAGLYNDAWLVAFRIPNLFRDLFAEGALSAAFIPSFTETLRQQGRREAWHLANLVLSILLVLLGLLTVLFFVFSDLFVHLLAAGFDDVPGKVAITSTLIKILSPFLLLVAMASVAMGVLNTFGHFFWPALAPSLFNLALIIAGVALVPRFEEAGILPIYAMGVGAIVGGILQFAFQLPLLKREGFSFRPAFSLRHPAVTRMGRLIGPAVVGISAVQINVLVNTQIASFLGDNGPVSWLSYAFRVMFLPIGLFGVAVGSVNLRNVSIYAAEQKWEELKETVANSVRLIAFLAIPSTVGLLVLARLMIHVLFERGGFSAEDTRLTALALMAYSVGLYSYSCIKVYVPTFYALNDTKTPVRISLAAVVVNIVANLILIWLLPTDYKFVGLAVGTSISVTLNNSWLAYKLRSRLGSFGQYKVGKCVGQITVASAVMGVVVALLQSNLTASLANAGLLTEIGLLTAMILVGILVYVGVARLFGIRELGYLISLRRR